MTTSCTTGRVRVEVHEDVVAWPHVPGLPAGPSSPPPLATLATLRRGCPLSAIPHPSSASTPTPSFAAAQALLPTAPLHAADEESGAIDFHMYETRRTWRLCLRARAMIRKRLLAQAWGAKPRGAYEGGDGDQYTPHPAGAGKPTDRQLVFCHIFAPQGRLEGPSVGDRGPSGLRAGNHPELVETPAWAIDEHQARSPTDAAEEPLHPQNVIVD